MLGAAVGATFEKFVTLIDGEADGVSFGSSVLVVEFVGTVGTLETDATIVGVPVVVCVGSTERDGPFDCPFDEVVVFVAETDGALVQGTISVGMREGKSLGTLEGIKVLFRVEKTDSEGECVSDGILFGMADGSLLGMLEGTPLLLTFAVDKGEDFGGGSGDCVGRVVFVGDKVWGGLVEHVFGSQAPHSLGWNLAILAHDSNSVRVETLKLYLMPQLFDGKIHICMRMLQYH